MFKVCIISCGMIANSAHIPAYRQFSDDFEIVAVSDINPAAAQDTAKRHGIDRFYTDAAEMLEKEKPDGIGMRSELFSQRIYAYGAECGCKCFV